ncbi:hypothetical protein BGZ98_006413 [Dissophora globulifera]|nr:hypothetical protein BGZ98_006413 [Dissophora globulifera]
MGYSGGAGAEGGIGTLNVVASMARAPISTKTTFYSRVNLAPPISSATVLSIERGAVDQKVWYTIQVNPYNFSITSPAMGVATASAKITIGSSSNSAGEGAADDIAQRTLTKLAKTCIPLKPYKIYRRYDDIADFADQLREELLKLMRDSLDLASQEQPLSASASSIHQNNLCIVAGSSTLKDRETATMAAPCVGAQTTAINAVPESATAVSADLAGHKFRPVLLVTKATPLQQKEEFDRYLQELFSLGPAIAQSHLVSYFFAARRTDVEIHPSQENQDSLGLNPLTLPAKAASTISTIPEATTTPSGKIATVSLDAESNKGLSRARNSAPTSSVRPTMTPPHSAICLASPTPFPNPEMDFLSTAEWTSETMTQFTECTQQSLTEHYLDSEMASPTDSTAPIGNERNVSQLEHNSEPRMATDTEGTSAITMRTIKKFKSLRRNQSRPRNPQQKQQRQQEPEEDVQASDEILSIVTSKSTASSAISAITHGASTLRANSSIQASVVPKAKPMKRSKTLVFRPEVTMQPLSSKNVIPPWNRIPSVAVNTSSASSASSSAAPASPTTPVSLNSHDLPSPSCSPNTTVGENATATTPTIQDLEDRPRKLTMTHSKTMSAISSISSPSYWGDDGTSNVSSNSNTSRSPAWASSNGVSSTGAFTSNTGSSGNPTTQSTSTAALATTLVAPWNRVNPNVEPNTHLHSLIKVSTQASPSNQSFSSSSSGSTYVPVELGRSFHKKEGLLLKSHTMAARNPKDRTVPLLTQPPESRSKGEATASRLSDGANAMPAPMDKSVRSRLTHSISAPGGFLPSMAVSSPEKSASFSSASRPLEVVTRGNAEIVPPMKTPLTPKKRSPRRESATNLHSPSLSTKQPVGILKNANQNRKSSLTAPTPNMFPVHSNSSFSPTVTAPVVATPYHGSSVATTFKIVVDADTIVALQIFENKGFVLTLKELKKRVKIKLLKSNIQLPDKFDLTWVVPSASSLSASSSALNTPTTPLTPSTTSISSALIHHPCEAGIALQSDEDLQRATHSLLNRKMTLRCHF